MTPTPLIVIADPDTECAVLMARQLELAGYEVVLSAGGDETVALVEERRPDALVIEAKLSARTGYAVVRELRSQPRNRLMPIVMVSARAGKLDRDFAFTVGCDDYLRKPCKYTEIVASLARLAPASAEPPAPIFRRTRVAPRPALA